MIIFVWIDIDIQQLQIKCELIGSGTNKEFELLLINNYFTVSFLFSRVIFKATYLPTKQCGQSNVD